MEETGSDQKGFDPLKIFGEICHERGYEFVILYEGSKDSRRSGTRAT